MKTAQRTCLLVLFTVGCTMLCISGLCLAEKLQEASTLQQELQEETVLPNTNNQPSPSPSINDQIRHIFKTQDDESTFLDVFGEHAKIYLTQHLIPPTDAQCQWNWKHARCEPFCQCSMQLIWGDYHLGRACRFRHRNNMRQKLGLTDDNSPGQDFLQTCQLPPNNPYTLIFQIVETTIRKVRDKTIHLMRTIDLTKSMDTYTAASPIQDENIDT